VCCGGGVWGGGTAGKCFNFKKKRGVFLVGGGGGGGGEATDCCYVCVYRGCCFGGKDSREMY